VAILGVLLLGRTWRPAPIPPADAGLRRAIEEYIRRYDRLPESQAVAPDTSLIRRSVLTTRAVEPSAVSSQPNPTFAV
jgi:hypothetical protein